jgi:hypothetical protein
VLGACWEGIFGDGTMRRDEVQGKVHRKGEGRRKKKKIKKIKKIKKEERGKRRRWGTRKNN